MYTHVHVHVCVHVCVHINVLTQQVYMYMYMYTCTLFLQQEFQNHTHNWPHLDLTLDCCRCLFPSFSSSSPSSCGLLADIGGVTIKSDLNFSIPRFELNTSALRKLTIMAAEKRIPALPGYEIMVFNYQLLGISLVNKEVR